MDAFDNIAYDSAPVERPGCVTAYAILLWLGSALYVLSALYFGVELASESAALGIAILICGWLMAAIPIATGFGLWQMKKWGWALVVVSQALGVIGALFNMLAVFLAADMSEAIPLLCGGVIGLLINGGILYWFITNRHLFDQPTYVMGPEGTMVQEKSSDNTMIIVIVVGVVAVLCIIPIVIIAILMLLGPQIGEVFSSIIEELGTPTPR